MKKIRMITMDGPDGLGKTTQMNELKKYLYMLDRGYDVYNTKLLGGDGTCEYQAAFRKILLHEKFPKDSIKFEEMCFAESDLRGIEMTRAHLEAHPKSFCLKDRALASHVVYALAKGMSLEEVKDCHREVVRQEQLLNREFGVVHLIFVPDNVDWLLERIARRSNEDGVEIVERLENRQTQERVVDALRWFKDMDVCLDLNVEIIEIVESDSILDVRRKVVDRLESAYTF